MMLNLIRGEPTPMATAGGCAPQWSNEIDSVAELVKDKLYFAVTFLDRLDPIKSTEDIFYFNIGDEYVYLNYYMDFGPLNISCLYKYCLKLHSFMQCPQLKRIVHYTSVDQCKRVNCAYLIGSYCVVFLNMDPKNVYKKLLEAGGAYKLFVDASQGVSRYTLKLVECLQGIHKAYILNFINFDDFSSSEYDLYDKIQNGDFNWLVPRKFLALIGPIDKEVSPNGHSPSFYVKYFLRNDVRTVIRLNNKLYDPYVFTNAGIAHYDLFFPDGTTPPKHILMKFLQIAENTSGAIAVHCKAGLGRTGSLIGAFIVKHYQFTAKEAIAWMRICRPGSVIGQQQGWLEKIEPWLWKEGRQYRLHQFGDGDKLPHHKYGIYSKMWQHNRKKFLQNLHQRAIPEGSKRPTSPNFTPDLGAQYTAAAVMIDANKENLMAYPPPRRYQHVYFDAKTQGDRLNEIKIQKYYNSLAQGNNFAEASNVGHNGQQFYGAKYAPARTPTIMRPVPAVSSNPGHAKMTPQVNAQRQPCQQRPNKAYYTAFTSN